MKKIVRGNDFTLRVPVRRIVNGEKESFPCQLVRRLR